MTVLAARLQRIRLVTIAVSINYLCCFGKTQNPLAQVHSLKQAAPLACISAAFPSHCSACTDSLGECIPAVHKSLVACAGLWPFPQSDEAQDALAKMRTSLRNAFEVSQGVEV